MKNEITEHKNELYNHEMLEQALDGLLAGLEIHHGNISKVARGEILDYSNIYPAAFDYYYGNPAGILKEVHSTINDLVREIDSASQDYDEISTLMLLFERLRTQPKMLKIIILMEDIRIWRESLEELVRRIAFGWRKFEKAEWNFLFKNLCCQFNLIIEKWSKVDFSVESVDNCVRLVDAWLELDAVFLESNKRAITEWTE